jgi:hypothetical protein
MLLEPDTLLLFGQQQNSSTRVAALFSSGLWQAGESLAEMNEYEYCSWMEIY